MMSFKVDSIIHYKPSEDSVLFLAELMNQQKNSTNTILNYIFICYRDSYVKAILKYSRLSNTA